LNRFKLDVIDDDESFCELIFQPFHYTIFEDQEMVHVTVARRGGDLEDAVMVKTRSKLKHFWRQNARTEK
jgi:hypothetical protein